MKIVKLPEDFIEVLSSESDLMGDKLIVDGLRKINELIDAIEDIYDRLNSKQADGVVPQESQEERLTRQYNNAVKNEEDNTYKPQEEDKAEIARLKKEPKERDDMKPNYGEREI